MSPRLRRALRPRTRCARDRRSRWLRARGPTDHPASRSDQPIRLVRSMTEIIVAERRRSPSAHDAAGRVRGAGIAHRVARPLRTPRANRIRSRPRDRYQDGVGRHVEERDDDGDVARHGADGDGSGARGADGMVGHSRDVHAVLWRECRRSAHVRNRPGPARRRRDGSLRDSRVRAARVDPMLVLPRPVDRLVVSGVVVKRQPRTGYDSRCRRRKPTARDLHQEVHTGGCYGCTCIAETHAAARARVAESNSLRQLQRARHRLCALERASEAVLSIAVFPRWVTPCFLQAGPRSPIRKVCSKGGTRDVSIPLKSAADLDAPAIRAIIAEALERASVPIDTSARRVWSSSRLSARQRPRRPS